MSVSILDSVKTTLGLQPTYNVFDQEIIIHINSVFSTLAQLGIGPHEGFSIETSASTWEDYIQTEKRLNAVKSYMFLRVKLLFDPPSIGFVISAMEKQILEHEWRLTTIQDEVTSELPVPPTP